MVLKDKSRQIKIVEDKPETLLVIGAGLPRTGTLSMKSALTTLLKGKCYHMAEYFMGSQDHMELWMNGMRANNSSQQWKQFFKKEGFIAGVDYPFSLFWKELSEVYPNAKIVLTTRDSQKWCDSVYNSIWIFHTKLRNSWIFRKTLQLLDGRIGTDEWLYQIETSRGYGMSESMYQAIRKGPQHAENFFKAWESVVISTIPKERLLVHSAKEGWAPLCQFLDLPIPEQAYPNLNDAKSIRKSVKFVSLMSYGLFYATPSAATLLVALSYSGSLWPCLAVIAALAAYFIYCLLLIKGTIQ